jgi:hypothetical protein
LIISNHHRFVYLHIHKCGGTSVEVGLEPHLAWNDLLLGSTEFGEVASEYYQSRFGLNKHSWLTDVERVCGKQMLASYYLFANVRHPAARVCSLYNYVGGMLGKLERETGVSLTDLRKDFEKYLYEHYWVLGWAATQAFVKTSSFSGFLRHPALEEDAGYLGQAVRLRTRLGTLPVQVFRLEDQLNDMCAVLYERFGFSLKIPHENRSVEKLVDRSDLGAEDNRYIHERFREDFDLFGY